MTGITLSEEKNVELSYVIGEFTFVDTPQIYEHGSIIEGKVSPNGVPVALWMLGLSCFLNYQYVVSLHSYNTPLFLQINAVGYNNTPISDMLVYLFEEKGWSSYLRLQNLTTDSRGIARFSVNTTSLPKENINLVVSMIPSRFERLYTLCQCLGLNNIYVLNRTITN